MQLPVFIISLLLSFTATTAAVRGINIPANTSPVYGDKNNFDFEDEAIFQIQMRKLQMKNDHALADNDPDIERRGGKGGKGSYAPGASPVASPATSHPTPCCDCSSGSGKGKGGKGKGSRALKGKGGSKGSKGSGGCTGCCSGTGGGGGGNGTVLELQLIMLPPNATIPVASGSATTQIGTTFIYNDALLDLNATVLNGAFVTGYCHRIQALVGTTTADLQEGTGYCHFTWTITDSAGIVVTFNGAGEVVDRIGGTLAITGGTGALQGVGGEVEILPAFNSVSTEFDFFLQAQFYVAVATLVIPSL
jgi:hypothetical protein